jgi:hypothetical protein
MSNKDLKMIKDYFLHTKVAYINDVPLSCFEPLYRLGLIDTTLCKETLKTAAVNELIRIYKIVYKNSYKAGAANQLDKEINEFLMLRAETNIKAWNDFKAGAIPTPYQLSVLKDMYQKAQVFYSKPLMTISDLDTIAGVDGAPYY